MTTQPRRGEPWTVRVAVWRRPSLAGRRVVVRAHDRDVRRQPGCRRHALGRRRGEQRRPGRRSSRPRPTTSSTPRAPPRRPTSSSCSSATPARTVEDPAYATELDDVLARMGALTATVDGVAGPVFANIVDPRLAPPQAALVSPDQTTIRIAAEIPGEQPAVDQRLDRVRPFLDELRSAHPGLRIHSLDGRWRTRTSRSSSTAVWTRRCG